MDWFLYDIGLRHERVNMVNYKKQRNYMTKLSKTAKLEYFNNLKLARDNKPFEMQTLFY